MLTAHRKERLSLRYVITPLLFISFSTPALATEYNWQGSYLGIYTGGALGSSNFSTEAGAVSDSSYFASAADIGAVNSAGNSSNASAAPIIGLQAGRDWVNKQMVYGVGIDYGALPLRSSENATYTDSDANQHTVSTSMSTNWLMTLRGRIGYSTVIQRWPSLIYLTGGMAITQLKLNNGYSDNSAFTGAGSSSTSADQIGWVAGTGIEVAAFSHASLDVEYLYVQMPSVTTTGSISNTQGGFGTPAYSLNNSFATTGNFHASLLKLAFNYRFND